MKRKLTLFLSLTTLLSFGQIDKAALLLGTWESNDKNDFVLFFQENGTLDFTMSGDQMKADYKFTSDSTLLMGTTLYEILTLSETELVMETTGFFPRKYSYAKSELALDPINEYDTIVEVYSNGNRKVEEIRHNGFLHGKFTEWYESGQVKRIQNFFVGRMIGKQEFWHENGQKKEEKVFSPLGKLVSLKQWDEKGKLIEDK